MEDATELEFLRFFAQEADFGPADEDVRLDIQARFELKTGKRVPHNYRNDE